jgi:hypothetical protein
MQSSSVRRDYLLCCIPSTSTLPLLDDAFGSHVQPASGLCRTRQRAYAANPPAAVQSLVWQRPGRADAVRLGARQALSLGR